MGASCSVGGRTLGRSHLMLATVTVTGGGVGIGNIRIHDTGAGLVLTWASRAVWVMVGRLLKPSAGH